MAQNIDPYYEWLGIPPAEQPPNHYRLLGLALFEANANVIANAADRQMAHLRSLGTSKHAALAQRLLNELASAKVCLLKPEKKAAYDAKLTSQSAVPVATAVAPPPASPPPILSPAASPPAGADALPGNGAPFGSPVIPLGAAGHAAVAPQVGAGAPHISSSASTITTQRIAAAAKARKQKSLYIAAASLVLCVVIIAALIFVFTNRTNTNDGEPAVARGGNAATDPTADQTKQRGASDVTVNVTAANTDRTADNSVQNKKGSSNGQSEGPSEAVKGNDDATTAEKAPQQADDSPTASVPRQADTKAFPVRIDTWPKSGPIYFPPELPGMSRGTNVTARIPLDGEPARNFRPGLVLVRYPRQPAQRAGVAQFVLPQDLATPIAKPLLITAGSRFSFDPNENVMVAGYVRIDTAGEYIIQGVNRFGRDTVYADGKPAVHYSNRTRRVAHRRTLDAGYHPIVIQGFVDSDGEAGVQISRRTNRRPVLLSPSAFVHDPRSVADLAGANPYKPGTAGFAVRRDPLAQIDIGRDVVSGKWSLANGALAVESDARMRIQLPPPPAPNYDLTMTVRRMSHAGPLIVGLPTRHGNVAVAIDGWRGSATGLMYSDGTKPDDATPFTGMALANGATSIVTCSVREWGVQVIVGGVVFYKGKIDPARHVLNPESRWIGREPGRLLLGSDESSFTFTNMQLNAVGLPEAGAPVPLAANTAGNNRPPANNRASAQPSGVAAVRQAVPDADKQQAADKQVRELFEKEFSAAKKPADKVALASTLMRSAEDTRDDPAAMYVLMNIARTLAAEGGDATLALRAVTRLAAHFEIDERSEKLNALSRVVVHASDASSLRTAYDAAYSLATEYAAEDKYDETTRALKVAQETARKAKEDEIARQLTARLSQVTAIRDQYRAVKDSLEKLQTDPNDADANLDAGRWYWFVKDQVDRGLKHFARSNDPELKAAAEKDITNPTKTDDQVAVAEAWSELAAKRKPPEKVLFEVRAFQWYLRASANAFGLQKPKIEKRIDTLRNAIEKRLLADATKGGVVTPDQFNGVLNPGLVVEYFNDVRFANKIDTKVVRGIRTDVQHKPSDDTKGRAAAVRWTGWLFPAKGGRYTITVQPQTTVYIDNRPVMLAGRSQTQGNKPNEIQVDLSARPHHLRIEAPDVPYGAGRMFNWQHIDGNVAQPVAIEHLYHVPIAGEALVELRRNDAPVGFVN